MKFKNFIFLAWKVMENLSSSFRKFFSDYKGILVSFELS